MSGSAGPTASGSRKASRAFSPVAPGIGQLCRCGEVDAARIVAADLNLDCGAFVVARIRLPALSAATLTNDAAYQSCDASFLSVQRLSFRHSTLHCDPEGGCNCSACGPQQQLISRD
jgi:hypothetical protein